MPPGDPLGDPGANAIWLPCSAYAAFRGSLMGFSPMQTQLLHATSALLGLHTFPTPVSVDPVCCVMRHGAVGQSCLSILTAN